MLLSIKTRLKLTKTQLVVMAKHAGIARFTYNWGLAAWQDLYKSGLKPNKYLLKKFFNNHVKPEYIWIKEKGICQKITQFAFDQLGEAFDRFFKGQSEYPKFKKKARRDSFTIDAGGKPIPVGGKSIKLPTIGWVKTFEGLPHTTTTKLTISRIADDWYIAFAYEQLEEITEKSVDIVGVDLGINLLVTLSTGVVFHNPRHNTIPNSPLVSGLMQNDKLAQSIADCGFYEFKRQLMYKAKKFGSEIILAVRWFPSTKLCSSCGHKQDMPLSKRTYHCGNCGQIIDRDLNASINLSRLARA